MRILVIDSSTPFRDGLRRALARELPDAEISLHDPEQRGLPGSRFRWSTYDYLVLSSELPGGRSGIDWLRAVGGAAGFPPAAVILLRPDDGMARSAREAGAGAVFPRRDLDAAGLAGAIRAATPKSGGLAYDERTVEIDRRVLRAAMGRAATGAERALEEGYRFVRLIGQGAMTRVYLAERVGDGVTVVLKVLDTEQARDAAMVQRFAQEAELLSRLDSPYVVKVRDHGFTNAYGYIAMEFFSRGDLKQYIEAGVSPYDALIFALNIAYGLKAIHGVGIIHRDLKPANIMFRADGSMALADFGVSKRLDLDKRLTNAGELLGTPHYMAPEQFQGAPADARADLYSLGVILHELLTGRKPFDGPTLSAVAYQHMRGELPTLPRSLAAFQEVLDGLLAKDPARRYADATAVIAALGALVPRLEVPAVPHFSDEETLEVILDDEQTMELPYRVRPPAP